MEKFEAEGYRSLRGRLGNSKRGLGNRPPTAVGSADLVCDKIEVVKNTRAKLKKTRDF